MLFFFSLFFKNYFTLFTLQYHIGFAIHQHESTMGVHEFPILNPTPTSLPIPSKMLMFTLAISYLTTSNLPWFMDLIFQVPMQCCSLQHQILLSPPDTSTPGPCFHFGSVSSFLLELFLRSSPVAHWTSTNLGSSSFSVISFCLFILFMAFSRHECWSCLPFPSPVGHILSELSTLTFHLGWTYLTWLIVSLS